MMSYSMALVVLYDNGQSLNTCPIRILLTQKTNHTEDMSTQALHAKMKQREGKIGILHLLMVRVVRYKYNRRNAIYRIFISQLSHNSDKASATNP